MSPLLGANGMGALPAWADLEPAAPQIVATMRRYLTQIGCVLRPRSVENAGQALRCFAAFLIETAPEVTSTGQVMRRHIEDFKPWLAARPGQNKPRVTAATIAHRLGTLRMFFVRLDEWGWDEAPPRVPMFPGDLPRQDHPLPKALDDASAARLLRAACNGKRLLVRVTVEMLLRTGLRVSEYTSLRAGAVVHIGAGPWLHVPVGKLREDRYLPLHPHLVTLIGDYRTAHVAAGNPLLLPRENGRALDRHTVTRMINRAGAAASLPHIHPHQLRHTLATQAINRGMSLEAIAAMLGHYAGDRCQVDHGWFRYRRAAAAGDRLSSRPDFGPGVALIAGLADGGGDHLLGLGDEAGQGVQSDGAVAEPVGRAQRGEGVDGLGRHRGTVVIGAGCGQFAGFGEPWFLAFHEAFSSSRASSPSKTFCRPIWPLLAASSRCFSRVGRNSMVVWKNAQDSQMDSK